jgi:hypothetical protein
MLWEGGSAGLTVVRAVESEQREAGNRSISAAQRVLEAEVYI